MPRLLIPVVGLFASAAATGLLSCSPAYVRHTRLIGPETWTVECGEDSVECYQFSLQRCPYGYDVLSGGSEVTGASVVFGAVRINRETGLIVRCKAPTFCESQPCEYGTRCIQSQRFPGRQVCAVQE